MSHAADLRQEVADEEGLGQAAAPQGDHTRRQLLASLQKQDSHLTRWPPDPHVVPLLPGPTGGSKTSGSLTMGCDSTVTKRGRAGRRVLV